MLASGLVFQLPMVIYFLTKAGLVDKFILREYRRHAIVIILVFGAILTPPDPFSQIVLAIPLIGLYQISIYISGKVKNINTNPSPLDPYDFALRASANTWKEFGQPIPKPMYHGIWSASFLRDLKIEGLSLIHI